MSCGGFFILTINFKVVVYHLNSSNKLVFYIHSSGEVDLFWLVAFDKVIRCICIIFLSVFSCAGKHCMKRITFALVCWVW